MKSTSICFVTSIRIAQSRGMQAGGPERRLGACHAMSPLPDARAANAECLLCTMDRPAECELITDQKKRATLTSNLKLVL
eukprot:6211340-Pleurochrysis_carterae.AAC.2